MNKPSAKVIEHSVAPNGEELITLEIELHRFILPEFNTHRCMSRNFQSSRAVPVEKMLNQVANNPAMPVHWGANQRGMQAETELSGQNLDDVKRTWLKAAKHMREYAATLQLQGLHKQLTNRLIEPFMWTKGVVTATLDGYNSFFALRSHKDAQPEIKALSDAMKKAVDESVPDKLEYGDYHLPYFSFGGAYTMSSYLNKEDLIKDAVKVSTSCCAQVSYRVLDDSLEKAKKIYDMLNLPENGVYKTNSDGEIEPPHCYDGQTEVLTNKGFIRWDSLTGAESIALVDPVTSTFKGFSTDYTLIKNDYEGDIYHYEGKSIDLFVTEGHNLYASRIAREEDRGAENYELFAANTLGKYKTYGESSMKMLKSAKRQVGTYTSDSIIALYELIGFFIGDGSLPSDGSVNSIKFHLKKKRKIEYLQNIVRRIPSATLRESKGGHFTVTIAGAKKFFSQFYNSEGKKTLSSVLGICLGQNLVDAIFLGLKNSDGSAKRKTWVYSTSSEDLKEDIIGLGAMYGYTVTVSNERIFDNPNHNTNWILNVGTRPYMLVGDSRSEQTLTIKNYVGKVYCADTGGNVLIVRRNGKVVLSGNCSPTEHVAKIVNQTTSDRSSGNFHSSVFWQYRKALEIGKEDIFLEQ